MSVSVGPAGFPSSASGPLSAQYGNSYPANPGALMNYGAGANNVISQQTALNTLQGIFGAAPGTQKWDLMNPSNVNGYTLPDILIADSLDLGTSFLFLTILAPNELTKTFCPKKYTDKTSVNWRTMRTKPMMAARIAHRGVTRLFEENKTAGQESLGRFMVNHMCELELAATEFGQAYMDRIFMQMALAFEEAMQFEVLVKVVAAGRARYEYEQKKSANLGTSYYDFRNAQDQDAKLWDCTKNDDGKVWYRIKADIDTFAARNRNGVVFDSAFATYGMVARAVDNERAKMTDGGQRAVDAFEAGPFQTSTIAGLKIVYMTTARPRSFSADDLLTERGTYGSVAATPTIRGSYKRGARDIQYYCMHRKGWNTLTFVELLRSSGIFDQNGRLREIPRFITRELATSKAFTVADVKKVPFLQEKKNLNRVPLRRPGHGLGDNWNVDQTETAMENIHVVGQMTKESFTHANLVQVVDTVIDSFGDRAQKYRDAMVFFISLCKAANASPFSAVELYVLLSDFRASYQQKHPEVPLTEFQRGGKFERLYTHTTTALEAICPVDGNGIPVLNIPLPWNAQVNTTLTNQAAADVSVGATFSACPIVPGYQTAAGMRGIAAAARAGEFNMQNSAFMHVNETANEILKHLPLLEEVADRFVSCLPSDVLDPAYCRVPSASPDALDVFFENFINPNVVHLVVSGAVTPLVVSFEQISKTAEIFRRNAAGIAFIGPDQPTSNVTANDMVVYGNLLNNANAVAPPAPLNIASRFDAAGDMWFSFLSPNNQHRMSTNPNNAAADALRKLRAPNDAAYDIDHLIANFWAVQTLLVDGGHAPLTEARLEHLTSICRSEALFARVYKVLQVYRSDPLRRAAALMVLFASWNVEAFEAMETHDVLAPVAGFYVKPEQNYLTTALLVAMGGSRTMNLFVKPGPIMMGVDPIHRMGYWNGSMYFGCVIYNKEAFLLLHNVEVQRYIGGSGDLPAYDLVHNKNHYDFRVGFKKGDERRSWFFFVVGLDEAKVPNHFSVTGKLSTAATPYTLADSESTALQYSSAAAYDAIFQFTKARASLGTMAKKPTVNHICRLESIKTWNVTQEEWVLQEGNDNFAKRLSFDERCPQQYIISTQQMMSLSDVQRNVDVSSVI